MYDVETGKTVRRAMELVDQEGEKIHMTLFADKLTKVYRFIFIYLY